MNAPANPFFLEQIILWAAAQAKVQAIVLVGSCARGAATAASDVDFVILVYEPGEYLVNTSWITQFGIPSRQQVEDYGRVISLRVWYTNGPEVEFGLAAPDWAAQPLDAGTDRVLMDGVQLLFERSPVVSPVIEGFSQADSLYADLVLAIQERANAKFANQNRVWFKNADFQSYGLKAADHQEISRAFRQKIHQLPLRGRLHLARLLVLTGFAEQANFANAVLARSVEELGPGDFAYLDDHIGRFHGWGQTDDFCINVLQPLLWKFPAQTLELLHSWNRSESLWKRRASVVAFVRKVGASGQFTGAALELCQNLLGDEEDLVRKGVGWALKDALRGDREQVLEYIKALRRRKGLAAITMYAIRDLKGAERQAILAIHPS